MDLTPLRAHNLLKGQRKPDKLLLLRSLIQSKLHDTQARDFYGNTAMHWACHALNAIPDVEEYALRLLRRAHKKERRDSLMSKEGDEETLHVCGWSAMMEQRAMPAFFPLISLQQTPYRFLTS